MYWEGRVVGDCTRRVTGLALALYSWRLMTKGDG